jgi:hypothetical protein
MDSSSLGGNQCTRLSFPENKFHLDKPLRAIERPRYRDLNRSIQLGNFESLCLLRRHISSLVSIVTESCLRRRLTLLGRLSMKLSQPQSIGKEDKPLEAHLGYCKRIPLGTVCK